MNTTDMTQRLTKQRAEIRADRTAFEAQTTRDEELISMYLRLEDRMSDALFYLRMRAERQLGEAPTERVARV